MAVHRNTEVLADLPQPVVLRVVQRLDPLDVRRQVREQDAAAQSVLLDPLDVLDRLVDVVEEYLRDAGALGGCVVAEVLQPTVVRPHARESLVEVFGPRRTGQDGGTREERRHRVGEEHLADRAVTLCLAQATFVVPVAGSAVVDEVTVGVLVLPAPRVELLVPLRFEVRAVGGVIGAGVAVGRDEDVRGFVRHCETPDRRLD